MKAMLQKTIVFIVLMSLLVVFIPVSADEVYLSGQWRDTGYDLAAGYKYTVTLDSDSWGPLYHAVAGIQAGPIKAMLTGGHLQVWINDQLVYDDSDAGGDQETVVLVITVDCDGSGYIEFSGQRLGGFSISQSYSIMAYTETIGDWFTISSRVTIVRDRLLCLVTDPNLQPGDEDAATQLSYNPLIQALAGGAGIAIVLLLLGFSVILLLIFAKQAQRRKWI